MKEIVQIIKMKYNTNRILSAIDRINQFFEYTFLAGKQPDELQLLKWVKVSKKRFDRMKNKVQNAKIIVYQLNQIGVALLILTNQTNYFKT